MNTLQHLPTEIIDKINNMAREMEIQEDIELNKNKFKSTIEWINEEFDWVVKSGNCELLFNNYNSGLRTPEDYTLWRSIIHEGYIGDTKLTSTQCSKLIKKTKTHYYHKTRQGRVIRTIRRF